MNATTLEYERPHLKAAIQAATWISHARVATEHGCTWQATLEGAQQEPDDPWLYSGSVGVVLFLLELYGATADKSFLNEAFTGIDHLTATLPFESCEDSYLGLYSGIAGAAYMFELAHQVGGRSQDRESGIKCIDVIHRHARIASANGRAWGRGAEIQAGRGGAGLGLLWWARATNDADALELAIQAGHAVVKRAKPHHKGGLFWERDGLVSGIPGFMHGSSGPAYFLAALYEHTRESSFLSTAIEAAHYFKQIAIVDDGGRWFVPSTFYEQGGELLPLRSVKWCDGAPGIWRPFFQLARVTGEPEWTEWVHRLAYGAMNSDRQEVLPDSSIQCCGDSGVAQAYLDLHCAYGKPEHLAFARRLNDSLMRRATLDETGMHWEAVNDLTGNTYPPQTGFMSGAAGIGTWMLHLDGFEQGRKPVVTLPDSPF